MSADVTFRPRQRELLAFLDTRDEVRFTTPTPGRRFVVGFGGVFFSTLRPLNEAGLLVWLTYDDGPDAGNGLIWITDAGRKAVAG